MDGKAQEFEWMTYSEMDKKVAAVGSALAGMGVQKGGAVGIYASNSPEWMISMKGIDRLGARPPKSRAVLLT